jgi:hypothetical protein
MRHQNDDAEQIQEEVMRSIPLTYLSHTMSSLMHVCLASVKSREDILDRISEIQINSFRLRRRKVKNLHQPVDTYEQPGRLCVPRAPFRHHRWTLGPNSTRRTKIPTSLRRPAGWYVVNRHVSSAWLFQPKLMILLPAA